MLRDIAAVRGLFFFLVLTVFPLTCHAEITRNASEYGLRGENPPELNHLALQSAIDSHIEGKLDVLLVDRGFYSIDGSLNVSGWDGLSIIGEPGAVINTVVNRPVFYSERNGAGIRNGIIRNLTLSSTYSGIADFVKNPALFFADAIDFHDFIFDNVEFTAPNASVNGLFVVNEKLASTKNITFKKCSFHHLGRMGAEFVNRENSNNARYFNITFESNGFSHLGLVGDSQDGAFNSVGISLRGSGDGALIANNVFGDDISIVNIESAGLNNALIRDNKHQGNAGSMYRFSSEGVVSNLLIENEQGGGRYQDSYFWNLKNVRINNVSSSGRWIIRDSENISIKNLSMTGNDLGVFRFDGVVSDFLLENSQLKQLDETLPMFVFSSESHDGIIVRNSCLEQESEFRTLSSMGGAIAMELLNISSVCDESVGSQLFTAPQLSVTRIGDGFVSMEWAESAGNVSHYVLFQDGVHSARFDATQRSYTARGLANGQKKNFMVRAFDAAGKQRNSNEIWVTPLARTVDRVPPSEPRLSVSRIGDGFVRLHWSAAIDNVGISHYMLYQHGARGLRIEATQSSHAVRELPNGKMQAFMLSAFDVAGNRRNSNDVWVIPVAFAEYHEAPTVVRLSTADVGNGLVGLQ